MQAGAKQTLLKANIDFRENQSLKPFTSFKTESIARIFVPVHSIQDLCKLQKVIIENHFPFFFLGGGSNILISDKPIEEVVIYFELEEKVDILEQSGSMLIVRGNANCRAPWFAKQVSAMGYTGLEFLTTIPGQLGGAVIQNAGCYGYELTDSILNIGIIEGGQARLLDPAEADFGYRTSRFKTEPHLWIFCADFALESENVETIEARIKDFSQRRLQSQPRNRRSAGSIFKNPPSAVSQFKAWQLIDKAGLRGVTKNDAEISSEHCNFIVNRKNATADDIYYLLLLAEKTVKEKTGICLEREVIMVGDFSHVKL